jgi:hypothetical protein
VKLSQGWRIAIRSAVVVPALICLALPPSAEAKGSSGSSSHSRSLGKDKKAEAVARDANGRIARSAGAKTAFRKQQPCPATGTRSGSCPGYVIDHVTALKRGGADSPGNMQWQTRQAAQEKDKWE